MDNRNERIGPYCHGCARAILAAVALTIDTSAAT